jgi:DNA invertase Pin-like site-specific DNA recombinase
MEAAEQEKLEMFMVDDLSRLARSNLLMLTIIVDLRFRGVRVVSVADGLDSDQANEFSDRSA